LWENGFMSTRFPALAAILVSVAATNLAPASSAHAGPVLIDRLEASVNSALILLSDVRKFRTTAKLRQQLDPLFAETAVATKGASATNSEIVDFLIDERLITQTFPVGDAEVDNQINQIQTNNHIDRAQLKSALAEQGFTFDEYFELIRSSTSKRSLIDRDIRTKVTISEDDIKNYFYNHYAKSAEAPSAYRLQIITVSVRNYKTPAAAREVAARAAADLKNGESFEEVAKRSSDGPTAQSGGDLGEVSEDQMSKPIREQVKKLRIGQVSEIFGSPKDSYNLIRLVDVKTADNDRLEKMKDQIRGQLTASEYQHQIALWLDRQRPSAFIHRAGEASTVGLPGGP
jgi:peptidyl-prolyl cis-trans isomerase SurA